MTTFFNNATAAQFMGVHRKTFSVWLRDRRYADGSPLVPASVVGQHKIWHISQLIALRDGQNPPAHIPTVMGIQEAAAMAKEGGITEGQFRYLVSSGKAPVHVVGTPPKIIWVFTPAMVQATIEKVQETRWVKPGGFKLMTKPPIDQFIYPTDEEGVWKIVGLGKTRKVRGLNQARERARLLARGSLLETIGDQSTVRRRADVTRYHISGKKK